MADVEKVDFNYADADKHEFEMAELYSYTEEPDFATNQVCFEEAAKAHGVYGECRSREHMYEVSRECVLLYLELGLYTSLVQLLAMEVENSATALMALRKPAVSITDSKEL
ncbi:striatin-interacting protein 1 homolog, partial [Plakobranchus ocellatus]